MSLRNYIRKTKKSISFETFPEQFPQAAVASPALRHLNRINRSSQKRKKSDALYRTISKPFLALPENNFCRVHFALTGQKIQATCIHHIRGRHKTLKFDTRFFCPTASKNSLWPHENIEKARTFGLIADAGDWHREPGDAETERLKEWMIDKGIY